MEGFVVRALNEQTWPAYADLIERHNGIWGGCWCMGFHEGTPEEADTSVCKRDRKLRRVQDGIAHASIVFDGETAIGWCSFGPASEIRPQNKFKRKYLPELVEEPRWRISCFFVDKHYRGRGVSALALDGALEEIANQGGGLVEAYPENVEGRKLAGSFICLGTVPMFERRGFVRQRQVAMHHWVMVRNVLGADA